MTPITLPLHPAPSSDEGRALARIPSEIMREMKISPGDTVSLQGTSLTHCRALPGSAQSNGIAVDASVASRIGLGWGADVALQPAPLPALASVTIEVDAPYPLRSDDLTDALFDLPLTEGDSFTASVPPGRKVGIVIRETDPPVAGLFGQHTLILRSDRSEDAPVYDGIGGLEEQIARVHEMVSTPLERPDLFAHLGISAPRGILFTGPPGTGKTLLARAVAARTKATFFHIAGPEIVSKHYGDSEAALRNVFDAANRAAPAIIFIDEIDALAPRRDGLSDEKQVERRVVAQLLTLLDGLSDRGLTVVMAATNLPDSIDPALRRPGRFDREITFRPPGRSERRRILDVHFDPVPLDEGADLDALAAASSGYVGADLAALAREAALSALSRSVKAAGSEDRVDARDLTVTMADLDHGLAVTRPSVLRDTVIDSTPVRWEEIGGLEDVKSQLQEAILWPLRYREVFSTLRVPPVRGVLLSGPPGCGKTLLARALAEAAEINFIGVRPTRILSRYLGSAERAVAELFAKARHAAPALLFFDEFDTVVRTRGSGDAVLDRIVAQFLVEMDGMSPSEGVIVLGATNRAAVLDPALTRPGRIDLVITLPLPDATARLAILEVHSRGRPLASDVDLRALAEQSEGATGADLAAIAVSAARNALRRHLPRQTSTVESPKITEHDFQVALRTWRDRGDASAADFISRSRKSEAANET